MWLELLTLFWIFFKIGAFTFGGGYAMIPLMEQEIVGRDYIDLQLFVDFIGISESTPGPISVNMATFIGFHDYGVLGAIVTTTAVILPSFIIILIIAAFGQKFLESKFVKDAFTGLKPAVIGLIFSVAFTLLVRTLFPHIHFTEMIFDFQIFNYRNLIILTVLLTVLFIKKKTSPILLILLSAGLGLLVYALL